MTPSVTRPAAALATLVLGASCAARGPAEPEPLAHPLVEVLPSPGERLEAYAHCHTSPLEGGANLGCRTWGISRIDFPTRDPGLRDEYLAGLLEGAGAGAALTGAGPPLDVAGARVPTESFSLSIDGIPASVGWVAFASAPPSGSAVVACFTSVRDPEGPALCEEVMVDLLRYGLPADLPPPPDGGVPTVIGREVFVPEGALVRAEPMRGAITLPEKGVGAVDWIQLAENPTPEDRLGLGELFLGNFTQVFDEAPWSHHDVPCRVEEGPGSCWLYQQETGEPPIRTVVVAYGEYRGIGLLMKCLWHDDETPELPEVCHDLMDVEL